MAYLVKKEWYNGYRCGCCERTWESDGTWLDNLDEALAQIPETKPEEDSEVGGGLIRVSVTDGATGETIAFCGVNWPHGFRRGVAYRHTLWVVDKPAFKDIKIFSPIAAKTWDELLNALRLEEAEEKLKSLNQLVELYHEEQERLNVSKERILKELQEQ